MRVVVTVVGSASLAASASMRSIHFANGLSSPCATNQSCIDWMRSRGEAARVVELQRLPRRAELGVPVGVAGPLEREHA